MLFISKLTQAATTLSALHHQLFKGPLFLLSPEGRVLDAWIGDFMATALMRKIREAPSFLDFFPNTPVRNLQDWPYHEKGALHLATTQEPFGDAGYWLDFITSRTFCLAVIHPLSDDEYLCAFEYTKAIGATTTSTRQPLVWLDNRNDTLIGFNQAFYRYFLDNFPKPRTLLGRTTESLLSISPLTIEKQAIESQSAHETIRNDTRFTLDQSNHKKALLQTHPFLTKTAKGVEWLNKENNHNFIELPETLDPLRNNWTLEMEFDIQSGSAPLLIFGCRLSPDHFPDVTGYTGGVELDGTHLFIKRAGYLMARSLRLMEKDAGPIRMVLCKCEWAISLTIDPGGESLVWHDVDWLKNPGFRTYVGLRPGSHVLIRRLKLATSKRRTPSAPPLSLTALKERPGTEFLIRRFERLQPAKGDVSVYVLEDISTHQQEKKRLSLLLKNLSGQESELWGAAPALIRIKEIARRAALSSAPILIQGETGSGKEMLARFIHNNGAFAHGTFVKVDCSTLPPSLIESELFGHEKGAFTGAISARKGRLEEAQGGTLFLDEVGNLPLPIQAKLLTFLQDYTLVRVGGNKPIRLTLQLLSATNEPLRERILQKTFREDLLYRINVFELAMPPLRERLEDLPMLTEAFIRLFADQHNKGEITLDSATYARLLTHPWPGNVRELRNIVQRAVVLCEGGIIRAENLQFTEATVPFNPRKPSGKSRKHRFVKMSREAMVRELGAYEGNLKKMAEGLGTSRLTLYKTMKRLGLNPADYR